MNNPFLSDRNIFSKVTNPVKKKSQTQKKDQIKKTQAYAKPSQIDRESFAGNYNYQNKEKDIQNPYSKSGNAENKMNLPQKMTFGVPNQDTNNYTNNANNKNYVKPNYAGSQFQYKPSTQYNQHADMTALNNHYPSQNRKRQNQRINFQDNSSLATVNHQDFPQSSNFDEYSPITKPSPKLNESQFLNIQALGDDLNRFLAQSKNQDQLCKILGIEKKPREKITQAKTLNDGRRQYQYQTYKGSQNIPYESNNNQKLSNPFSKPSLNVPKQKVFQSSNNQAYESLKPKAKFQQESSKQSKEYIPTFNYVAVQQQPLTESRQQELLPRFNKIHAKQPPSNRRQQVLDYQPLEPEQNLEVFNYSKVNMGRQQISLQEMINKQMMGIALSGKYRTFLTSGEKLVMVKYKAEYL